MTEVDSSRTNALPRAFIPAGERMRIGRHPADTTFDTIASQIASGYSFASKAISSIASEASAIDDRQKPPTAPLLIDLLTKLAGDLQHVSESLERPGRKMAGTFEALGLRLDQLVGELKRQMADNFSSALPELMAASNECLAASAFAAGDLAKDPLAQLSLLDRLDRVGQRFVSFGEAMLLAPRYASSAPA